MSYFLQFFLFVVVVMLWFSCILLISMGIVGFDEILGGGLLVGSFYLIQGLVGSGKIMLVLQVGFVQVCSGNKVMLLMLIVELYVKMFNYVSNFDFFDESLVGDQMQMLSGYGVLVSEGLCGLLCLISVELNCYCLVMFIIDGFCLVCDLGLLDLNLFEFMYFLNVLVFIMNCIILLLLLVEGNMFEFENILVDGVIELSQYEFGMQLECEIKVFKLCGVNYLLGKYVFEINWSGVEIFFCFEVIVICVGKVLGILDCYVSVGILFWDKCIGGGVVSGLLICLLGSFGVGKMFMGLYFIE